MNHTGPARCVWYISPTGSVALTGSDEEHSLGSQANPGRAAEPLWPHFPRCENCNAALLRVAAEREGQPGTEKTSITPSSPHQPRSADVTHEETKIMARKGFLMDPRQQVLLSPGSAFAQSQWDATSHPTTPLPGDLSPIRAPSLYFEEAKNIFSFYSA